VKERILFNSCNRSAPQFVQKKRLAATHGIERSRRDLIVRESTRQFLFAWRDTFGKRWNFQVRYYASELGRFACNSVDLFDRDFKCAGEIRKIADFIDKWVEFNYRLYGPFSETARVSNDRSSPIVLHGGRKDFARGSGQLVLGTQEKNFDEYNLAVLHQARSNCRIRLAGLRRRLASRSCSGNRFCA